MVNLRLNSIRLFCRNFSSQPLQNLSDEQRRCEVEYYLGCCHRTICATIDDNRYLCNDTLNLIYKLDKSFPHKYILGLMNSKVIRFWHKKVFPEGLHIIIYQLKEIPIPIVDVKKTAFHN